MNKLLFALIAVFLATSSFSAVAADNVVPKTGASTATATDAAPAATDTAVPKKNMKHKEAKNSAHNAKMQSCKKAAMEQNLKHSERRAFIKDCMSKNEDVSAAKEGTVAPTAKKVAAAPAAKK
jgi:hypothetical protein